jgi:release factor glutamine methyltransferase
MTNPAPLSNPTSSQTPDSGLMIGDVMFKSAQQLIEAGIDSGSLEATLLLGEATGFDRLSLITRTADVLSVEVAERFASLLARRLTREPLQYILGRTEFMGLEFKVNRSVLIPRSDTETLVESVLDLVEAQNSTGEGLRAVDIGTGSGAIAVTLAKFLPAIQVEATDISQGALVTARDNALHHGVLEQITFREGDALAPLEGKYDLIISNPPYIPTAEFEELMPEVRDFEPALALTPGEDGLKWYRHFALASSDYLNDGGYLVLEVGHDQGLEVVRLLESSGFWRSVEVQEDIARIQRVIIAQK